MAIHPADASAQNPRMQCVCCSRWMRLHGKRMALVGGLVTEVSVQRFFGSCEFSNGGDHLAGKIGDNDVCATCCGEECKKLAVPA